MADLIPWKFCDSCKGLRLSDNSPCPHCGATPPPAPPGVFAKLINRLRNYRGKWSYEEDCECFVCSCCGMSALNDYRGRSTPSNFCPNCGKPMTVVIEEA